MITRYEQIMQGIAPYDALSRLDPMIPPQPMSIHKSITLELRAFGIQNVARLAARELHSLLLHFVESIEAGRKRVR